MNKKSVKEIKDYFFSLLIYIRPNSIITEDTSFGELELEDIDYTLIAIECEETFKVVVDENVLINCFFVDDALQYLISLVKGENEFSSSEQEN
jgi:hypothetical protein